MDVYLTILIISVALPTVHLDNERNLLQFYQMIECTLPNSSPLMSFADYGCYCGLGGSGSPVDQLDTCCRVHDKCYGDARLHKNCQPVVDVPYFEFYDFKCNTADRTIMCLDTNDECEMFICQCDKIAAECFAGAPYNASNNHLSSSVCSSASRQSCSFISALVALTVSLLFCNKISTK